MFEPPLVALDTLPVLYVIFLSFFGTMLVFVINFPYKKHETDISGPISQSGIEALAVHKYKSSPYTILDEVLNPWWTWAADQLPTSLAPNVVTLLGWLFYIPTEILVVFSGTSADTPRNVCVYLLASFSVFWYQTFDAMDGKQARKLKVAGPLGQLVDHGCDAVSTAMMTIIASSALRLDHMGYLTQSALLLVGFFLANWAEKYTHVLMTSVSRFLGVTEAQYLAITCMAMPAIFGVDFWTRTVENLIGNQPIITLVSQFISKIVAVPVYIIASMSPAVVGDYLYRTCVNYDFNRFPIGYTIIIFLGIGAIQLLILSSISVCYHIYQDTVSQDGSEELTTAELAFLVVKRVILAFSDTIPMFLLLVLSYEWYYVSLPTAAKPFQGAWFYHPLLSQLALSFVGVHIICQIILNGMSNQPNSIIQPVFIPVFIVIGLDIIPHFTLQPALPAQLHFIIYCICLFSCFFVQVRYSLMAVHQISNLFGIYALKLGPKVPVAPVKQIQADLESQADLS